jgi:hypothetical protein
MIDICFSDSVVGMLKCIKREIKSDGIFSLWMFLNLGNIDCEDLIAEQVQIEVGYYKYFSKNTTDEELEKIFSEQLKQERKKFEKFKKYINDGHKIRLWISNTANNRCGLYWLCNFLKGYTNELSTVVCPGYEYDDISNKTEENRNWSKFSNPWSMAEFIKEAHIVCEKEKIAYSKRWEELIQENAQLRILVDDMIVGVNEDFFDNAILGFVSAEPESQNRIMGKMLGKWQSGDIFFLSKRIEYLIEKGKIKVCENRIAENGCYWGRTIALA